MAVVRSETVQGVTITPGTRYENDHRKLKGRDAEKQHPISAIDGLAEKLDEAATEAELEEERNARIFGDANLQREINFIDARTNILVDDVEKLTNDLKDEVSAREEMGAQIRTEICTEANLRIAADNQLENEISEEANLRTVADNNLHEEVVEETANRNKADAELQIEIDTNKNSIISVGRDIEEVRNAVRTEEMYRKSVDATLQDEINELKSRGKFLSTWDCTLGLPKTVPTPMPYKYSTGDYYIVSAIADETTINYRPSGEWFTGEASKEIETDNPKVNDTYYFDGREWILLQSPGEKVSIGYGLIQHRLPKKGDLIELSITGKTKEKFRVLSIINGVAELLYLASNRGTRRLAYSSGGSQLYHLSDIDIYLRSEFYESLSERVKDALVAENFYQTRVEFVQGQFKPNGYNGYYTSSGANQMYSLIPSSMGQGVIVRGIYLPSVEKIMEYFGLSLGEMPENPESSKLSSANIRRLFWDVPGVPEINRDNVWLLNSHTNVNNARCVNPDIGDVDGLSLRAEALICPIVKLDLAKLDFEKICVDTTVIAEKSDIPEVVWEMGAGEGSVQQKGTGALAMGKYSVAEGYATAAWSDYSHVEGWNTRTNIDTTDPESKGHASHAEGSHTIAKGSSSHAEGNSTESMGWYSHAEGSGSISGGISSHAEGDGTITNNYGEHAEGRFNLSTPQSNSSVKDGTLHSVGIGTRMNDRKNAVEITQNGDYYLLGVGDYDGINRGQTLQTVVNNKQDKLIAGKNIDITDNVISIKEQIFIAEYNETTYDDIMEAHNSGKICFCRGNSELGGNRILPMQSINDELNCSKGFVFSAVFDRLLREYYVEKDEITGETVWNVGYHRVLTSEAITNTEYLEYTDDNVNYELKLKLPPKPNNDNQTYVLKVKNGNLFWDYDGLA